VTAWIANVLKNIESSRVRIPPSLPYLIIKTDSKSRFSGIVEIPRYGRNCHSFPSSWRHVRRILGAVNVRRDSHASGHDFVDVPVGTQASRFNQAGTTHTAGTEPRRFSQIQFNLSRAAMADLPALDNSAVLSRQSGEKALLHTTSTLIPMSGARAIRSSRVTRVASN
jgi:hypothetical protein